MHGRRLACPPPGPRDAEHDLEQREQRSFWRAQMARRSNRHEARDRELHDAEQREQAEVARACRKRHRERQRDEGRDHRADQHGGQQIDIGRMTGMLDHDPVDCRGDRHAERHQRAEQVARIGGADLARVHPRDADAGDDDRRPGARGQPMAEEHARDQRGEQRRDRHRDEHVGHRRQRDRDHERGEHHAPAHAGKPQRAAAFEQRAPQHRGAAQPRQQDRQREHRERAAPERDLEAVRRLEVACDDAGDAPHQRDDDHRHNCSAVGHDNPSSAAYRSRSPEGIGPCLGRPGAAARIISSRCQNYREPGCRTSSAAC